MTAKSVTLLGATGSIGCSTLDLISREPERFSVTVLTANENVDGLIDQARRFRPTLAVIGNEARYDDLKQGLSGTGIEVAAGEDAIIEAAGVESDFVMAGIVGAAGLRPVLKAIRRGATIGLANKECLVCAGDLMMREVEAAGATLLPVDSEHNAIFQVFDFDRADAVSRIILTASGGPFRDRSLEDMRHVTPEEAVNHPNWDMGDKISVDSATLMNKGLECIEAFHLFPITADMIDVVIHPQSVIHSMVEYRDGSVLAQLGTPDMRTPIAYTLDWPNRMASPSARLNFAQVGTLSFEAPDLERFPALGLALDCLAAGGAAPIVLNAANEVAVADFLCGGIGFLDIAAAVGKTLEAMPGQSVDDLGTVFDVDKTARIQARQIIGLMR